MKINISVKVYDPSWLEKSRSDIEDLKQFYEEEDLENMKYISQLNFKINFEVYSYELTKTTDYVIQTNSGEVTIPNVMMICFKGEKVNEMLIVSNELLHGEFSVKNSNNKKYIYIYLKGDLPYMRYKENIWIYFNDIKYEFLDPVSFDSINDTIELISMSGRW